MEKPRNWNDHYQQGFTPWDCGRPSEELIRVLAEDNIPRGRAIELGCGTGNNAVWLAQEGFDVTAIDLSPLAIDRARERAASEGVAVNFLAGDLLAAPDLGPPADFLFDRGCYHAVRRENATGYTELFVRSLKSGGYGLVLAGNANERHEPGPPVVSEQEIRSELGSLLTIVWLREFRFDSELVEGMQPLGWSCLLRKE